MRKKNFPFRAGLLPALLALALLAGCGGAPGGDVSKSQPDPDATEITDAPEIEEIPVAFRPVIGLTTDMDYHYDDDLHTLVNRMETQLPGVDADTRESYPELAAALDNFRENLLDTAREGYQEREDMLPEFIELGGNGGYYEMYGDMRCLIRRADAQAVSVVNAWSEYAGGTHGSYGYAVSNFDTSTGAEITLESLLTPEGALTLNSRLGEELNAVYPDLAPGNMIADYLTDDYTFSLEPDGVTFWFNPNEIASFADGLLTVKLYFNRDADMLNDAYASADEMWFVEIGESVPYRYAAANQETGSVETWTLGSLEDDSYSDWSHGFGLEFDAPDGFDRWEERPYVMDTDNPPTLPEGRVIALDNTTFFDYRTFYAHTPFGDYLIVILDMEDDNHDILVYSSSGELVQRLYRTAPETFFYPELPEEETDFDWDDYTLYHSSVTNPDDTRLCTHSDLFGTWNPGGSYRFTDNGFRLQDNLLYGSGFTLTLKQDLTVTRCEPDEWTVTTDKEITIPAGTQVDTVAVNPEQTTAWFRVPNPTPLTGDDREFIFTLSYDNDEWPRTVNGIEEDALFDGLQYAG